MPLVNDLEKLAVLRRDGALTEDEFIHAKRQLISTPVVVTGPAASVGARPEGPTRVEIVHTAQPGSGREHQPAAIVAFVLGLLSMVLYPFWFIPAGAFVCGWWALNAHEEERHKNKWMGVVGVVLGGVYGILVLHKNNVF